MAAEIADLEVQPFAPVVASMRPRRMAAEIGDLKEVVDKVRALLQ